MRDTKTKASHRTLKNIFNGQCAGRDTTMNANEKIVMTATTSKKFAFTYDHVNKKIVGTDIAFQKAGVPGSALEAELNIRIEARPTYGFTVIPTKKKPAKRTYKGLTKDLMKEYIKIQQDKAVDDLLAQLDNMIEEKKAFPTIKSWFLDEFKNFSVSKAQRDIQQFRLNTTKANVRKVKAKTKSNNITEFNPATQTADQPQAVNF